MRIGDELQNRWSFPAKTAAHKAQQAHNQKDDRQRIRRDAGEEGEVMGSAEAALAKLLMGGEKTSLEAMVQAVRGADRAGMPEVKLQIVRQPGVYEWFEPVAKPVVCGLVSDVSARGGIQGAL